MTSNANSLPEDGRVVIIGGGPGGTACALALQRLAGQMNRRIQILLLESKQFAEERHYNQCAGVLSPPLAELLEQQLGVPFPYHLVRGKVPGYVLHAANQQILLKDREQSGLALRRVQFDAYMLENVIQRGIQVLPARAVDLEFHTDNAAHSLANRNDSRRHPVVVYTEKPSIEADVVVGAFGLDAGSAAMFARSTAYRPPQALDSVVTKYHPGPDGMAAFGPHIHAFMPAHPHIEFGAITPKGNHLTINIAGRAVNASLMRAFLESPAVQAVLPNLVDAGTHDPNDLRFFKGRFPRSIAKGYYGDRYVMVGDAAGLVRAFKGKGVTSAVQTGIRAAHTILQAGITHRAFHRHYRIANQDIIDDLLYGKSMRRLAIFMARYGLLGAVLRAARHNPDVETALFNAVSAHAPYRQVLAQSLRPYAILSVLRAMLSQA